MADDGSTAAPASLKRPAPADGDDVEMRDPKRRHTPPTPPPHIKLREPHKLKRLQEQYDRKLEEEEQQKLAANPDKEVDPARVGLRRALVLALDHVGFNSATDDALESFLLMTENYFHSLAEEVSRFALAGRRTQPIPLDFEAALPRFNLGTGALRPHLKNPVERSKLEPPPPVPASTPAPASHSILPLPAQPAQDMGQDLPLLSAELSGRPEKVARTYIPSSFPDFPSIHTYRNTPVDVDTVTVVGSGLKYDDGSPLLLPNEEATADDRELGLAGAHGSANSRGATTDPKRIREAAAIEAKQAEEALRGLMRASKVNKLKEVRAAAGRNAMNKQRYALWEAAMRELIMDTKGDQFAPAGLEASPSRKNAAVAAALREEIADQSMMVNAEKAFHRKEVPRKSRRVA